MENRLSNDKKKVDVKSFEGYVASTSLSSAYLSISLRTLAMKEDSDRDWET